MSKPAPKTLYDFVDVTPSRYSVPVPKCTASSSPSPSPSPSPSFSSLDEDRLVLMPEFLKLQAMTGRPFTLDCCANPSGDNALVTSFLSPAASFFDSNLSGQHCWINPPFSQARQFVQHYRWCKSKDPTISACFLLPRWASTSKLCDGMQLLHSFPKGHHLFSAPNAAVHGRHRMPGVPWPVDIFYDPSYQVPDPVTDQLGMLFATNLSGLASVTTLVLGN